MENQENYETKDAVPTINYTPNEWYWLLEDGRYWSSALGEYVLEVPEGAGVTKIDTEENLSDVLRSVGIKKTPIVSKTDVHAERDRRLSGGFLYDFGDERGVHLIRTSAADMIGWDEVTKLAQAQLNIKNFDPEFEMQPIIIATGTGVTQVTPIEWQHVMLSASAFRQPIWSASFILENMEQIPKDYSDDAFWP